MSFTTWLLWLRVSSFAFLFLCSAESQQSIIKTLPGYPGPLPFKLETGYVDVGESDEISLFYYFIESERDPQDDPLVLWLTGGPGCSGLCGLAFEIGPIAFDASSFNGSLLSLVLRQHSWTKIANVIFIDSPVVTGYSYSRKPESYHTSDSLSAKDTYTFLRKWLLNHPAFIKNRLYIAGDSYAGKIVPMVVLEISKGNDAGCEPPLSLQGYLVGNPITIRDEANERIPYAHGMALISHEYYESAKSSCSGNYVNPDPNNAECLRALQLINECTERINIYHILEPSCNYDLQTRGQMLLEDYWIQIGLSSKQEKTICRDHMNYKMSYAWANNPEVQDALGVGKGTTKEWKKCNTLMLYEYDVSSAFPYHQVLSEKQFQVMVYSGDHDFMVPYTATFKWVQQLNLTVVDSWRPWNVEGQIAGYAQSYKKNDFYLTFATIKGAGHTAPEYNPEQCLAMAERFFTHRPL